MICSVFGVMSHDVFHICGSLPPPANICAGETEYGDKSVGFIFLSAPLHLSGKDLIQIRTNLTMFHYYFTSLDKCNQIKSSSRWLRINTIIQTKGQMAQRKNKTKQRTPNILFDIFQYPNVRKRITYVIREQKNVIVSFVKYSNGKMIPILNDTIASQSACDGTHFKRKTS